MIRHMRGVGIDVKRRLMPTPLGGDVLYYDEETEFKVLHALVRVGLTIPQAQEAMQHMSRNGIVFRERKQQ